MYNKRDKKVVASRATHPTTNKIPSNETSGTRPEQLHHHTHYISYHMPLGASCQCQVPHSNTFNN